MNIQFPEHVTSQSDIGGLWIDCNIILSDRNGIFIPKYFAESFLDDWNERAIKKIPESEMNELKAALSDPSNQFYWDNWDQFLYYSDTSFIGNNGLKYRIEQEGDLWEVALLCDNLGLIDSEEKCGDMLYRIMEESKRAGFNWDIDDVLEELLALLPVPYCFNQDAVIDAFKALID